MAELYTVQDLMKLFKKKVARTIRNWIHAGKFPHARKVGGGWYIPQQDIDRMMAHDDDSAPVPTPPRRGVTRSRFLG